MRLAIAFLAMLVLASAWGKILNDKATQAPARHPHRHEGKHGADHEVPQRGYKRHQDGKVEDHQKHGEGQKKRGHHDQQEDSRQGNNLKMPSTTAPQPVKTSTARHNKPRHDRGREKHTTTTQEPPTSTTNRNHDLSIGQVLVAPYRNCPDGERRAPSGVCKKVFG